MPDEPRNDDILELINRISKSNLSNFESSIKNDKAILDVVQVVIDRLVQVSNEKKRIADLIQAVIDLLMNLEKRLSKLEENDANPKG